MTGFFFLVQASQLGVYRAFVDNYELAVETAEKCCQANAQFAEISEVTAFKLKVFFLLIQARLNSLICLAPYPRIPPSL